MVYGETPSKRAGVDVELPRGREENRRGQEYRAAGAGQKRFAEAHEADTGQRREGRSHRGEIVEVKETSSVAVDHAVREEPAGPQEHRQTGRRRPSQRASSRGAERSPSHGQRQQPTDLTG